MYEEDWGNEYEGSGRRIQSSVFTSRKRPDSSDNPRAQNEHKNYRKTFAYTDEVDIRSDRVGLIIGRAGSNVQKMQNNFNVHVNVDKNRPSVKVSGNSRDDVDSCLEHIRRNFCDSGSGSDQYERPNRDAYNKGYDRESSGQSYGKESSGQSYGKESSGQGYGKELYFTVYDGISSQQSEVISDSGVIDWAAANKKAEAERKKRWEQCPELIKSFYQEVDEVANLSNEEVARIRLVNNNISASRIFVKDPGHLANIPNPVSKFQHCFAAYPDLMEEVMKQGFTKPTPIQSQAWPILLKGEDMIGIAQTGTGKTLAFLLPAMIHIEYQPVPRSERTGPNVLIMAPTRELALQIEKEVRKYQFRGMKAVCLYGGGSRRDQIDIVQKGVEIMICTPGRLNDLIAAKVIDITSVTYLVLDEADRMLDLGFEPQIRKILLDIRPDRQTVMTSATWPPGVRRLAESYMVNPIQVIVGSLDLAATHTVHQKIELLDETDKYYTILKFLKELQIDDKVIVFCSKKVRADDLSSDLSLAGLYCQAIHGSREQADREQAIADITSGEVKILVATDIASRGLDIEDVTYVINYDFPRNIEEYVHRVGRTGRAGRTGTSISYVTREDWSMASELIPILEEADQFVPDGLRDMADRFLHMKEKRAANGGGGRNGGRFGGRNRQ